MQTDNFKTPQSQIASLCKELAIRAGLWLNRRKPASKFLAIVVEAAKRGNTELYGAAAAKAYQLRGVSERVARKRARLEALQFRVH
jgi:hypothetical protein